MIYNQSYEHVKNKNLLPEQQFSTEAVKLTDSTCISKPMESGKIPCHIYIHLPKAFDTLSLDVLLETSSGYIVLSGTTLKLLCYLENRRQYVTYKSC